MYPFDASHQVSEVDRLRCWVWQTMLKCVRYVAKNIRVFSEAGIGEPVVLRRLYVKAKSMKQCWVDE